MARIEAVAPDAVAAKIRSGDRGPLYLVVGDRVLAEPAAIRIGEALAEEVGCSVEVHRRPAELGPLLADLKTFALFGSAKVLVAVESTVLADAGAAAQLIDEALEVGAIAITEDLELTDRQRRSASRLLQTLRLYQIDPFAANATEVIAALPDAALAGARKGGGGHRRRGKRQIEEARGLLVGLLDAARAANLAGWAETEVGELVDINQRGLPEGHALVLAESAADRNHPLVGSLAAAGRLILVGQVEAGKSGDWQGLDLLADELARETGVTIAPPALEELARRTIQRRDSRGGPTGAASGESTARLAGEYRKLATLMGDGEISLPLVENVVQDRGEEDAWKTLDAIGAGQTNEAFQRIRRLLAAAEDPTSARLSFFALLAGFARQLVVLSSLIDALGIPRRTVPYPTFKSQLAPRLQADLEGGGKNPIAGLHPYRLYRVFNVACKAPAAAVTELPARVLETELRLKGESREPDVALSSFVAHLTTVSRNH